MSAGSTSLGAVLAEQMEWTRDWTRRLLADVSGADWTFQPQAGIGHILWTCGHLAVSQNVLVFQRCLGKSALDEAFSAHFPMGGPIQSAAEHKFPEPKAVLDVMESMQAKTLAAIREMSDVLLREPAYGKDGAAHPHYRDKLGAVTHCFRHEAFHAGQIALVRRLLGKSFLR